MTKSIPQLMLRSYAGDPLAQTINKWRVGRTTFALAYLILWAVNGVGLLIAFAIFWPSELPAQLKFQFQTPSLLFALLLPPLVSGFYHWISFSPAQLLEELAASQVFQDFHEQNILKFTQRIAQAQRLFGHRGWPLASVGVAIVTIMLVIPIQGAMAPLVGQHAWVGWLIVTPAVAPGYYMVSMILAREICVIISLRRLFNGVPITVYPWHPDRCGGLRPLNRYALRFTYIIAIAGFGLSLLAFRNFLMNIFYQDYMLILSIAAYAVLAPFCFFATLGAAHEAMKTAKDKQLEALSQQFNETYQLSQKALREDDSESLRVTVEKIEHAQRLYKLTEAFPVWPFDTGSIRRFLAAVIGSLLPALGSAVVEVVIRLVGLIR